jgi:hypothetical protein
LPIALDAVVASVFVGIFATAVESIRRRDGAALVNSVVVVTVSLLPVAVERLSAASLTAGTELTAWLGFAGFLHMVGMLGVYESVWWYDHITHTVSAALVAALCYGGLLVTSEASRAVVALLAVGLTFAGGVCWELIELVARALGRRYDIEPVLVHYGWDDTAYDLLFDLVGALVVVTLDVDVFTALAAQAPGASRTVLAVSTATIVVGSLAMAAGLTLAGEWPRPEIE